MKKENMIYSMLFIFLMCMTVCSQTACSPKSEVYLEEYENEIIAENDVISDQESVPETDTESKKQEMYYVYICGAVENPGVYAVPKGSRIYEVIQKAGGLTQEADNLLVNQAEEVTDGMMIQIYTQEEAEELGSALETSSDGKLDINKASVTDFTNLPGIGMAKAEAIVTYRETNGKFSSIEDLMNIPGIKEGVFNQLKEHIKVN